MKRIGNLVFALILTLGVGGTALLLSLSPSWADVPSADETPGLAAGETSSRADEVFTGEEVPSLVGEWQPPADDGDKAVATPGEASGVPADDTIPVDADASPDADTPTGADAETPAPADASTGADAPVSEGEWTADLSTPAHPSAPTLAPTPTSPEGDNNKHSSSAAPSAADSLSSSGVVDSRTAVVEASVATADTVLDAPEMSVYGDDLSQSAVGAAGVTVDFSVLDAALADTSAIQRGSFTQASWDALQAAIVNAQSVRSKVDATQAEADAAVSTLASAKVGLVVVGSGSGGIAGGLPQTGDTVAPLMGTAVILTLLGAVALLVRRARQRDKGTETA